jgi:hypothetical protein
LLPFENFHLDFKLIGTSKEVVFLSPKSKSYVDNTHLDDISDIPAYQHHHPAHGSQKEGGSFLMYALLGCGR